MDVSTKYFWFLVTIESALALIINWIVLKIKLKLKAEGFEVTWLYGHLLDVIYFAIRSTTERKYKDVALPVSYFVLLSIFGYLATIIFFS